MYNHNNTDDDCDCLNSATHTCTQTDRLLLSLSIIVSMNKEIRHQEFVKMMHRALIGTQFKLLICTYMLVSQATPSYEKIEKGSGQMLLSPVSPVHRLVRTNHVRESGHMTLKVCQLLSKSVRTRRFLTGRMSHGGGISFVGSCC